MGLWLVRSRPPANLRHRKFFLPVVLRSADDLGLSFDLEALDRFQEIGVTRHTRIKDEGSPAMAKQKGVFVRPTSRFTPTYSGRCLVSAAY